MSDTISGEPARTKDSVCCSCCVEANVMHRRPRSSKWFVVATLLLAASASSAFAFAPPSNGFVRALGVGCGRTCKISPKRLSMIAISDAMALASQSAAVLSDDSYKFFLSGGLAASISHGITVPIDVVKTRLQTDDALKSSGFIRATATLVRQEGVLCLSKGLGSTVIGYLIQGSLKYGLYEIFKNILISAAVIDNQLANFVLAATISEFLASSALCPMEATRIRLVSDPNYGQEVFDALPKLIEEKGLGIFDGLPAIWCKQVPYTMTQLTIFDVLTDKGAELLRSLPLGTDPTARFAVTVVSAMVAAVVSSLASQPGDTILSEVNKGGSKYGTSVGAIVSGMAAAAPADFFRGTRARLVHMLAIVTSQLVIYDAIRQALGIAPH